MKNNQIDILLVAIVCSLTILFFQPLSLYLLNREDILALDTAIFFFLLGLSAGASLLLSALLFLFKGKARATLISIVFFMTAASWTQSNILNWNYGLLDGSDLSWSLVEWRSVIDLSVWALLFGFSIYWGLIKQRTFRTALVVLLCIQSGNLAYVYSIAHSQDIDIDRRVEEPATVPANKFNFSNEENIIVLILDSYQTDVFVEWLEIDPRLSDALRGFTFYPDALGTYVSTRLTVPTLLTGDVYTNQAPLNDYLRHIHSNYSLVKLLQDKGYSAGVYSYWPPTYTYELGLTQEEEEIVIRDYTALRQISSLSLFRMVPHVLKNKVFQTFLFNTSSDEDRDQFLQEMRGSARVAHETPRLHWHHLKGVHFPWILNGERLRGNNRDSIMLIAEEVNELIIAFIQQLQQLGVYDNSAILIFGDHGNGHVSHEDNTLAEISRLVAETACFEDMTAISQEKMVFNYGWERALPMVLLKPFGATHEFQVSCAPVSLADIYPTILDLADIKPERELPGTSLLRLREGEERLRKFYFYYYSDRRKRPQQHFIPLYEYEVNGFCWHEHSFAYAGYEFAAGERLRKPLDSYTPGERLFFGFAGSGIQYLDENWHPQAHGHVMSAQAASLTLLTEDLDSALALQMAVNCVSETTEQGYRTVHLFVGDTLLETVEVFGNTIIEADIPREYATNGSLDLRLELHDTAAPQRRIAHTTDQAHGHLWVHWLQLTAKE